MGFPQAEQRDFALTAMGIQDPFCPDLRPQQRLHMLEMEESAIESLFVIMSDIQLDRPLVSSCDVTSFPSLAVTRKSTELQVHFFSYVDMVYTYTLQILLDYREIAASA